MGSKERGVIIAFLQMLVDWLITKRKEKYGENHDRTRGIP